MRKKDAFIGEGNICGYETVIKAEMYKVDLMAKQVRHNSIGQRDG